MVEAFFGFNAGFTQTQLARKIGETQTFISKCERGERRIDLIELRTFCHVFGISLNRFVSKLERALLESTDCNVAPVKLN